MEIDPLNPPGSDEGTSPATADARARRLNTWVAVTIALLATFVGICKVKDDNLVQAMQQAQADKLDHWSFYQARNIRQEVAQAELDQLLALQAAQPKGTTNAALAPAISRYQSLVTEQKVKKDSLRVAAQADQRNYDALNYRDDQFDLSDALTALAISLLALTSLTQKRWLFGVAMVATVLGVIMGLAGLAGWHIHPDALSRMLS
jgi:FtsZ-binding cell division protein ZapB